MKKGKIKSNKKKVALLMAAIMAVGCLFTGCAEKKTDNESQSSSATSQNSTEGTEVTPTVSEEVDHSSWVSEKPIEITVMLADHANQVLGNGTPAQEAILEKTNVQLTLELVSSSAYNEKKSVVLATGSFPDLIHVNHSNLKTYYTSGYLEPLMQYVNEETMPNFYKVWQEYPELQNYLIDGELYAFPRVTVENDAAGYGPVIRTDLLEKHGLDIPETFDDLLDVLAELKEIYPDSIPWATRNKTSNLIATTSYMLGAGSGMYYDFDKGQYQYGQATEEFKAVLEYLNRAYELGVLNPEYATSTAQQLESNLTTGKSFFYLDNSTFGQNYTLTLRKTEGNEDAVLQLIPIPENSFGQRRAVGYSKDIQNQFFALNAKSKNKEEILKWIDWMYSEEGYAISAYGKEGYSFEYNENGEPEFIEEYVMQFKDGTPADYYALYGDAGIGDLNVSFLVGGTHLIQKIQKIDGNWSELTEEYWKINNADEAYERPKVAPYLTDEENARYKEITSDINTILATEYDKYIMGEEPIENWDNVIAKLKAAGVDEIVEMYNQAEARGKNQ